MSADNGIVILKTLDASGAKQFRVRELHNSDALFMNGQTRQLNWSVVQAAFANCFCCGEVSKAMSYAQGLVTESERVGFKVEHGVLFIESDLMLAV